MKKCCDSFVMSCTPRKTVLGTFTEIRACPSCGTSLQIAFEGIATLGKRELDFAVLGAE